ncbi:MAG: ArsR/SmtB family transcription factor [Acidimicrobiia bacterium]
MVFKALADSSRRTVLDRLHARNGQTLSEVCDGLGMARQSVSQHLDLLERANLVTTVRQGREKLHYLNPVPLQEVHARWIEKFEVPRLRSLRRIKQEAEHVMGRPSFVYAIYIESSVRAVWEALTDAEATAQFWGHSNVSDWDTGSRWEHVRTDGSGISDTGGVVLESEPPNRLVISFEDRSVEPALSSKVTFTIEPYEAIVRLTVVHEDIPDEVNRDLAAKGWVAVLSNLKSYLETGRPLSTAPWTMP